MTAIHRRPTAGIADPLSGTFWSPIGRLSALMSDGKPPQSLDRLAMEDAVEKLAAAEAMIAEQQERIAYLESLSMTDELTGLANRRGFNSHFHRERLAARRAGEDGNGGGVLVMIDLDGFKAINDTYGHLAGDAYLRHVARILTMLVRDHDVVARLGGDEFAILLTHTDADTGASRARQIADAARSQSVTWMGHELPVRFSIGVHAYGPEDHADEVMHRADAIMYREKSGRRAA